MLALQSVSQVAPVRVVLKQLQARPAHRIHVGKSRSRPDNGDAPLTGLELLQQLAEDEGFRVEVAQEEEEPETWDEAMDEMEDIWMREPAGESFAELASLTPGSSDEVAPKAVPFITADELQSMVAQDNDATLLVIDVRSSEEYEAGHLSAAQNVPLHQLKASLAEGWHSKTVVVVGTGDTRSPQACTRLSKVFKLASVFHLVPNPVLAQ